MEDGWNWVMNNSTPPNDQNFTEQHSHGCTIEMLEIVEPVCVTHPICLSPHLFFCLILWQLTKRMLCPKKLLTKHPGWNFWNKNIYLAILLVTVLGVVKTSALQLGEGKGKITAWSYQQVSVCHSGPTNSWVFWGQIGSRIRFWGVSFCLWVLFRFRWSVCFLDRISTTFNYWLVVSTRCQNLVVQSSFPGSVLSRFFQQQLHLQPFYNGKIPYLHRSYWMGLLMRRT